MKPAPRVLTSIGNLALLVAFLILMLDMLSDHHAQAAQTAVVLAAVLGVGFRIEAAIGSRDRN